MNRLLGALLALSLLSIPALVSPASGVAAEPAVIAGAVTASGDGAPLAGISVGLWSESGAYWMGTSTDASGHFQFPSTTQGKYRVRFTSENTITKWYDGDEVTGSVVTLGATGTVDASTTLKPAGIIRGTYTGPDPSRVLVKLPWFSYPSSPVFTVGGGEFTAKVTSERSVTVGLVWAESGSSIVRFNGNKFHWAHAPELQVAGGDELQGIAIDMPPTATVTGQITNVNGVGISADVRTIIVEDGDRIEIAPFGGTQSRVLTGQFSLVVPATTMTLRVLGTSPGDRYAARWLGNVPDALNATVLHPTEGQALNEEDITLPGGMTLWGVVRDTAGDPVPEVNVTAFASETNVVMGSAVTAADGTWSITGLGWGAMPGVNLRYTQDRLETSWFPKGPTQGWASDALAYASTRPGNLVSQSVNYKPEYRLTATGNPTIEGKPLAGLQVHAQAVPVTPTPDATRYQWLCNGVSLGLATESIQLLPETVGCQLTVRQISTLAGHQPAIVDSMPVTVTAPAATVRAAITGTPVSGNLLRATTPSWNFTPDHFSRQWYRNGVPIAGATGSTYRLATADVGDRISVKVSASETSTGLSASTTSSRTTLVKARTTLRARWVGNPEHISADLRIRVITPGQADPRGFISIKYYDHSLRYVVNGELIVRTLYGNRRGWVTVRINYGGSYRATPASMKLRVYMH